MTSLVFEIIQFKSQVADVRGGPTYLLTIHIPIVESISGSDYKWADSLLCGRALLERMLCKEVQSRISSKEAAAHAWYALDPHPTTPLPRNSLANL